MIFETGIILFTHRYISMLKLNSNKIRRSMPFIAEVDLILPGSGCVRSYQFLQEQSEKKGNVKVEELCALWHHPFLTGGAMRQLRLVN